MRATVFLSMVLMGLTVWGLDSLTPAYEPITWSQIDADRNKSVVPAIVEIKLIGVIRLIV